MSARGRQSRGRLTLGLRFAAPLIRTASRALFKERFAGGDNIPASGPVILVLNHISVLDPLATASFVWDAGRIPSFMIKDSVFKVPVVGRILRSCQQISVSRGSTASRTSLDDAVAALQRGDVVAVYPEGTVTRDRGFWPMRAKTGVARLALDYPDAVVVPIAQWGAHGAHDYHTKKLRVFPRKVNQIVALPPFDMSAYFGRTDAGTARKLTDDLMRTITVEVGKLRDEIPPQTPHSGPSDSDGGSP